MLQIGSLSIENSMVMAPMAGYTNLAFRLLIKRLGAGLVMTEMVSAKGLSLAQEKTLQYLASHPDEKPLGVQIFGADPRVMADAAKAVSDAGLLFSAFPAPAFHRGGRDIRRSLRLSGKSRANLSRHR